MRKEITADKRHEPETANQENLFIDFFKGRIPLMKNKFLEVLYVLIMAAFWIFIAWRISVWGLSIPSVGRLWDLFLKGRSP